MADYTIKPESGNETFCTDDQREPPPNMSTLTYFTYPGYGEEAVEKHRYSQAVRVGDRIECSGQGELWM